MENKKDSRTALIQVLADFADYVERLNAFRAEHQEYMKPLLEAVEGTEVKPLDPEDIFYADAVIKEIEEAGLEDAVEGFDELKYSDEVYHQFAAFAAENRYHGKKILEIQIEAAQASIEKAEKMLVRERKKLSEGNTTPQVLENIKELTEHILWMKKRIGISVLKLDAKQSHASN